MSSRAGPASAKVRSTARHGEQRAQRASTTLPARALARVGLIARAAVYLVLGYLTIDVALGSGKGKNASSQGALDEIARQPAGPALVVVLAVGFIAYAAWRLLQAAAGDPGEEGGAEAAKRLGWLAIAVVYLVLSARTLMILAGQSSTGNTTFSASKSLLDVGGPVLLGLVGAGVAVGGAGLSAWAVGHDVTQDLDRRRMPAALAGPSRILETFGNVVRGRWSWASAPRWSPRPWREAPRKPRANGTLHSLTAQSYGPALLGIAAAGFVAFGLASVVEALYRKVGPGG